MASNKPSPWAAKRQGTLNQFYTRDEVGALLTRELGAIEPSMVLDLGAGEGSLAASVARAWPRAHLTTVDIDPAGAAVLRERLVESGAMDHEHQIADVFDPALPQRLNNRAFDLAVCNPPFFRPAWRREFADILREADFVDACPSLPEATAEIIFLAQNLRLVRAGGTIALIVPDGLATGWRAVAFRRTLLRKHWLRSVIQLPPYSFLDTEAYCFVLILEKGGSGDATKLLRLKEDGSVSDPVYVAAKAAETRLDYAFHALAGESISGATTLRGLGADIRRGSFSTVDRKATETFVFHTGDFPRCGEPVTLGWQLPDTTKRLVVVEEGDILMARVDRELHEKITLVTNGKAAITDCVYRIRLPEQHRHAAFAALTSAEGRERIRAATKGVGARLLGKGELLDLPLRLTTRRAAESID